MAACSKGTCSDRTNRERIIFVQCLSRMIHSFVRYLVGQKGAGVAVGLDRRIVIRFLVGASDFCIYQNVQIDSGGLHSLALHGCEGCFSRGHATGRRSSPLDRTYCLRGVNRTELASVSQTFPLRMDCTMDGRDISKPSVSDLPTLILTLCQICPWNVISSHVCAITISFMEGHSWILYMQACDIVGNKQVIGKYEIISVHAVKIYAGVEMHTRRSTRS